MDTASVLEALGEERDRLVSRAACIQAAIGALMNMESSEMITVAPAEPTKARVVRGARKDKLCVRCGKAKGVTAFHRGGDVCRLCERNGKDEKNEGESSRPKSTGARRKCLECSSVKLVEDFEADSSICRRCEREIAKRVRS